MYTTLLLSFKYSTHCIYQFALFFAKLHFIALYFYLPSDDNHIESNNYYYRYRGIWMEFSSKLTLVCLHVQSTLYCEHVHECKPSRLNKQ